jgi:predicted DNA-binding WGR domain protein
MPLKRPNNNTKEVLTQLVCRNSNSNKFYTVILDDTKITKTWGVIGSKGQSVEKKYKTIKEAEAEYNKVIKTKKSSGYVIEGEEVVQTPSPQKKTKTDRGKSVTVQKHIDSEPQDDPTKARLIQKIKEQDKVVKEKHQIYQNVLQNWESKKVKAHNQQRQCRNAKQNMEVAKTELDTLEKKQLAFLNQHCSIYKKIIEFQELGESKKEKYNNLKEVVSNKAEALILVERDFQEAQDEKDTQQRAWEREQKDLKKLNEQLRLYEANDVNCV